MTEVDGAAGGEKTRERPMRLRYGVSQADSWRHFALGPQRERIWARLRELDTHIIRVAVLEKNTPDPAKEWDVFAAYLQAVLNVGATPMITVARPGEPFRDPGTARYLAGQCADTVRRCIEQWGGEVVRHWYWCVWHEPNNDGGLTFEQYRQTYEEVAQGILRWLAPYLDGHKALIGGPAANGFLPFWMDWMWQFVNEIDNSLVGFASWHRYGDWRRSGEWVAPPNEAAHRAMLISQTPDYEARAHAVGRLLEGRDIRNVCGELNAHSHHEAHVSGPFNQTIFGAAYYVSALLHLMRGGADAEIFRAGMDDTGRYGMLDENATPSPVYYAKQLCAQHIRYGDLISFPMDEDRVPGVDAAVARGQRGRCSVLFVHLNDRTDTFSLSEIIGDLGEFETFIKIDRGTGSLAVERPFDGTVAFEGYGVAAVTNGEKTLDERGSPISR